MKVWPMSELSLGEVRRRWGPGEYKVQWLAQDPDAPDAKFAPAGQSAPFILDPLAAELPPDAPPAAGPAVPPMGPAGDMAAAFQFALRLSEMTRGEADRQLQTLISLAGIQRPQGGPAGVDPEVAAVRAELAQMRAEATARAEREEIERRHREALETERRRADDAERRAREAETRQSAEEPASSFDFEGGGSFWESIGQGLIRAAARNPEQTAAILLPIAARLLPSMPPPPQAVPAAPPPPAQAPPPAFRAAPPPAPAAAPAEPQRPSEQQTPIGFVAPEKERTAVRVVLAEQPASEPS